jgi:nickel-dependent lactate racemase
VGGVLILSYAPGRTITELEIKERLTEALQGTPVRGKRVLVIIPDDTRTLPMPTLFETICAALTPKTKTLTFLVALGTHPPLTPEQLDRHLGLGWAEHPRVRVVQHEWDNPDALAQVGTIDKDEMREISHGLLAEAVSIEINRAVLTHDLVFLLGPVFPHEVVGFSGGHKYFFPGVSGPEIVHQSHWLGALITSPKTIGQKSTPVRMMIEKAATMVPTPQLGISLVMRGHDLKGLFLGKVEDAWSKAADLSAKENIVWVERPFKTVLSIAPPMYWELWTAGKCTYKLEPVVADGGQVIIYAPNLSEISVTHGELIRQVGYHTRDYFLHQWNRFKDVPRAILAHSSHVKGIGTFVNGVEHPRMEVTLATALPEALCREINLGYLDPRGIDPTEYEKREDEGILVVPNAGEMLFRLANGTVPDIDKL